jgi:LAO/AO transport system kinase
LENIVERLLSGDRRARARMVTLIENEILSTLHFLAEPHQHIGHTHSVGVTGATMLAKVPLSRILCENCSAATTRSA